jgi:hypothetical protein
MVTYIWIKSQDFPTIHIPWPVDLRIVCNRPATVKVPRNISFYVEPFVRLFFILITRLSLTSVRTEWQNANGSDSGWEFAKTTDYWVYADSPESSAEQFTSNSRNLKITQSIKLQFYATFSSFLPHVCTTQDIYFCAQQSKKKNWEKNRKKNTSAKGKGRTHSL